MLPSWLLLDSLLFELQRTVRFQIVSDMSQLNSIELFLSPYLSINYNVAAKGLFALLETHLVGFSL